MPGCAWVQSQKWQNDLCFQDKPFNVIAIQVYAPTTNAKAAEIELFYEDIQDLLELTPKKDVLFFIFCCFPLFLCIDCWGRLSYLSLLFFGTLHSDAYIFPFLLCFSLLFSQLLVRPPQTAILLFCISFPWGWSWSLSLVQCHEPHSIVHQALYQI